MTPTTKGVIPDAACSSVRIIRAPGHVSRTSRDGPTQHDGDIVVRYPQDNRAVLIRVIVVLPTIGNIGIQDITKKQQSTSPSIGRNAQTFETSVDGNLTDER